MSSAVSEDIIRFLRDVASDENMRVTIQETVKGGCITGATSALGCAFAGPVGLAVGGGLGGVVAAATCRSFKPVTEIISKMPSDQKEKLAKQIIDIMERYQIINLAALVALVGAGGAVRKEVIGELHSFVKNELQLSLA